MRYIVLLSLFLYCISCSNQQGKQQQSLDQQSFVAEDGNDKIVILDSMRLFEMTPQSDIFDSIFDISIDMIARHEVHEDLQDFDSFVVCIQCREEFQDTICWVNPQLMSNILLNDDPFTGFKGYLYVKKYPILVCGNAVSCLFNFGKATQIFYTGMPLCDGIYKCPRFRIRGNSFCVLDSRYP